MKPKVAGGKQRNDRPPNTGPLARDEPQATAGNDAKIQSGDLSLEVVHPDADGIDIGKESHYVAVPPTRDGEPVRCFGCTTAELKVMAGCTPMAYYGTRSGHRRRSAPCGHTGGSVMI